MIDVATAVLVAEPGASLSAVAHAAHISRTTLHSYFPTRGELLRAVGDRALSLCEDRVLPVVRECVDEDGGLRALTIALLAVGPQLAFLWRTPSFDHDHVFAQRWRTIEEGVIDIVRRARTASAASSSRPEWWDASTLFAVVYVASESIYLGRLAPLDAPDLVLETFKKGWL